MSAESYQQAQWDGEMFGDRHFQVRVMRPLQNNTRAPRRWSPDRSEPVDRSGGRPDPVRVAPENVSPNLAPLPESYAEWTLADAGPFVRYDPAGKRSAMARLYVRIRCKCGHTKFMRRDYWSAAYKQTNRCHRCHGKVSRRNEFGKVPIGKNGPPTTIMPTVAYGSKE